MKSQVENAGDVRMKRKGQSEGGELKSKIENAREEWMGRRGRREEGGLNRR